MVGRSLRPEAPFFVPRIKYEEIAEETEGREAGTISVEMDRLIGTVDEAGPSVSPLTPEEILYELLARPIRAIPQKGLKGLTADKEDEGGESNFPPLGSLREE